MLLPIRALVTPRMREAEPVASSDGYTDVAELAETIHNLWLQPAKSSTDDASRDDGQRRPS